MRSYWFRKLVRDHSTALMEAKGAKVYGHILAKDERMSLLVEKLKEEAEELAAAQTVEEKTEEVADILELMDAYINATGLSMVDIRKAQEHKRATRGGFDKGEFIDYIAVAPGSFFDTYCLAAPDKYAVKEIKE